MTIAVSLTGAAASNTSVSLTAAAASGGTGPYSYQFQRAPDLGHGHPGTFANIGPNSSTLTYTDSTVQNTLYWYQVVATDSLSATGTALSVPILSLLYPFPTLGTGGIT